MSRNRELLVLHATQDELRLACVELDAPDADGLPSLVRISHVASFLAPSKQPDASALCDQTALEALDEHIRQHELGGRDAVCIVGGPGVACQYFDMPPLAGAALQQAVRLKLGPQLSSDQAQSVFAVRPESAPRDGQTLRVQAGAIQKDLADAIVAVAERTNLNLLCLSASPSALAALVRSGTGTSAPTGDAPGVRAVLHLDERVSTLVVLDQTRVLVATELSIAADDLTAAYRRPIISGENVIQLDEPAALGLRNDVGIPSADQAIESLDLTGDKLLPLLEPVLQKFAKQLTQWLMYAATCNQNVQVKNLRVVGPGAVIPGLAAAMAAKLSFAVESADMLAGWASVEDQGDNHRQVERMAFLAAAAAHHSELANLLPDTYLRKRRIRQIRRVIALGGPIAACVIAAFGLLFGQLDDAMSGDVAGREKQLSGVKRILGDNGRIGAVLQRVRTLDGHLDGFSSVSPSWVGVFKELSLMLPVELRALEYNVRQEADGLRLIVRAGVHPTHASRGFDEIVTQTLLLLQRSAFFKRVELVSANRGAVQDDPTAVGSLAVELDMTYRRAGASGCAAPGKV